MFWKTLSPNLQAGAKTVEIRSLKLIDDHGNFKRHRVSTCWDPTKPKFSKTPAVGRLVKEKDGRIGVMVNGKHGTSIKIGGLDGCFPCIFVALNNISKKPKILLLKNLALELYSEGELIFAKEK
ncbi:MAG: hypothetical protein NC931_00510 [Candidatus Omnitrophica bacterium]|nr:hypothetical protein [Candidatus Omnitrophota bacterium]MCM8821772.1 hypothetical protein [Candidatus Omnitrophota bacterium]MCM8829097.1 hypothetical protein [Candidatus Omnitrophota bacterium]